MSDVKGQKPEETTKPEPRAVLFVEEGSAESVVGELAEAMRASIGDDGSGGPSTAIEALDDVELREVSATTLGALVSRRC